jgi:predicted ATPase/class 3 adenylate cyclase
MTTAAHRLPSGTVTFLFTDIEGSTKLAQDYPDAMPALLTRHHAILHRAIQGYDGYVFQIVGDSFAAAFHSASDALNAALDAQRNLHNEPWTPAPLKVRMGIHTGTSQLNELGATPTYSGYATIATAQRIMSAGHGGQILLSGATRDLVADTPPANTELVDLGEKKLRDVLRSQRLYQVNIAGLSTVFPPLKTLDFFPSNLPTQLTTFIGRENEIAEVKQELGAHRLVTLTGSGGTGKTRLSLQVAADLLDKFDQGVWFVELAPLTDPDLIPQTILSTIGVQERQGKTPLDALKEYFHEKQALILLDNCEHLVSASAQVVNTLLNTAPQLKVLASSREALGVKGEASYPVPSLSLPDIKHLPIIEELSQYEAVRLFIDRALLVSPHFTMDKDNAPFIAQICHRLDGIPLAIELAAARVKVLSAEQISIRLDDRFRLLTGGARTALPRQQTLRALIDWSYDLLTENERLLLHRLSVFMGGWSLEVAEVVCSGDGIETYDVLDLLTQLANKSLVVVIAEGTQSGETRYRLLETIRQYAREKVAASGGSAVIRRRHLDFFLSIALRFEREVHGTQARNWMKRVDVEHDNLREAMNWAGESGLAQLGLRLGSALHYYWLGYGYWSLGRESLERLLTRPEAAEPNKARADALSLAGDLAMQQGDLKAARAFLEESKAIGQALGDAGKLSLGWSRALLGSSWMSHDPARAQRELDESIILLHQAGEPWRYAVALGFRAGLAEGQGDWIRAREWHNECLTILRNTGDSWTAALPTVGLGRIFYQLGEYANAATHFKHALEIFRTMQEKHQTPGVLGYLGSIAVLQRDDERAVAYFEERLIRARELMNKVSIANALCDLGIALGHLGDYTRATALLREGLALSREIGNLHMIAACLTGLASTTQPPHRAVQILAAAQAALEQRGEFSDPLYRVENERAKTRLREGFGDQDFSRLLEQGYAMTLEQVVALALEENRG